MKQTQLAKISSRMMIVRKLDLLAKRLMVERYGDKCICPDRRTGQPCGKGPVQACHVVPKGRHPSMRFIVENLFPGCWYHHSQWWHSTDQALQAEARDWAVKTFGAYRMRRLELQAGTHGRKIDLALEEAYLVNELKRYEHAKAPPGVDYTDERRTGICGGGRREAGGTGGGAS